MGSEEVDGPVSGAAEAEPSRQEHAVRPRARPRARRRPRRSGWTGLYRNFRLVVVARIVVLGGSLYLFFHLLERREYPATALVVALAIAYQLWALIHYVERTNRDLSRFFLAIRHADFSQTFVTGGLGSAYDELKDAFNEVLDAFRAARAEKEEQARYLQTVVQHVGVGLIAYDRHGQVELINTAAKRLLHVSRLRHIRELETRAPELASSLAELGTRHKAMVRVQLEGEMLQLALYGTAFRLGDREVTLASLQNIQGELEEKEMEAWQNLIRVLTHEIMNSITPISSLAATASSMLKSETLDPNSATDVRDAVHTIHRRSEGLLHFVNAYRDLTRLPVPQFEIVRASELIGRVEQLMTGQVQEAGATLSTTVNPPGLELTVDPELIEQVLINLVGNATDAASGKEGARIAVHAHTDGRGRPIIEVVDTGPGIVEEALERGFIPFFTTKPNGTGIGLSLCRQIMRLHRGSITARSEPHRETVFTLRF